MERLSVAGKFCNAAGMQGRKPVTFQALVTDWSEDIITASQGCWGGDLYLLLNIVLQMPGRQVCLRTINRVSKLNSGRGQVNFSWQGL